MNRSRSFVDASVMVERNYKDTLFRMIFREPKELLKLYNAVSASVAQLERKEMKRPIFSKGTERRR